MKKTTLAGLIALGSVGAATVVYLLRRRSPTLRYLAASAAFLLPVGTYALANRSSIGSSDSLSFLFISDTHGAAASNAALVRSLLQEQNVGFIVHGGDLADSESFWGPWWETPFREVTSRWRVYAAQGNHDPSAGFINRFGNLPRVEHLGVVDLFLMPWPINDAAAAWLDRETAASQARYKILVTHNPVWPAVSGPNNLPQKLAASLPRLSLVLAGHNHVFYDTTVNGLRQVVVKSGPKNYVCDASARGCVANRTTYARVDIDSSGIRVTRRDVP